MNNIHATCVDFLGKGILFVGKSGSGKSDIALRMIMDKGAKLVADDRVDIYEKDGKIYGKAPKNLFKKIEIRNVGIAVLDNVTDVVEIVLCVELSTNKDCLERLPQNEYVEFFDVKIPKLSLYPFEMSTTNKIIQKICGKFI
jgi:serine kinase of HPr protein (carbohydrate metabolism regulator)